MIKPTRDLIEEPVEDFPDQKSKSSVDRPRTNWEIKVPQVRVIGPDGEFLGVMMTKDAVYKAKDLFLDLVEIVPTEKPPVCKIMDLGKWIYAEKKKHKDNTHKTPQMHEIRLTPNTEQHDIEIKARKALEFLKTGSKVSIQFKTKGREAKKFDLMKKIAMKFYDILKEHAEMDFTGDTFILHPKAV